MCVRGSHRVRRWHAAERWASAQGDMADDRLDGDLRLALLTGAAGWRDRNSTYSPAELAALVVLVSTILASVSVLLMGAALPADDAALTGGARWLAAIGAAITLVIGVAPSLAWPFGWRPRRPGPMLTMAVVRVVAAMVIVGCWTALMGHMAWVSIWPLGGVVGCECLLTAWALGLAPSGPALWSGFQRSSIHVGVLLVSLVVAIARPELLWRVLGVLLTFQVVAFTVGLVAVILVALRAAFDVHDDKLAAEVTRDAHGRLAYWLHNAVTTPLRHLRLRVQAGLLTMPEVVEALEQHEHDLRRRQLDEEFATGSVGVAQLVQLQVRRAEDQGVSIVRVPRFSEAAPTVDAEVGRLIQRVLDVLVPNAIAAGAGELGFDITADDGAVVVEVEDDAGGFQLAGVPAGRALDGLQRDLGPGRVTLESTDRGSIVRVVVGGPEAAAALGGGDREAALR